MKKVIVIALFLCVPVLGGFAKAHAVYFENTYDFSGTVRDGVSCTRVNGSLLNNNVLNPFEYTHTLSGIPAGSTLDNASLSLFYSGNFDSSWNPELWLVCGNSSHLLGALNRSSAAGQWVSQSFDLNCILASISDSNPWALQVSIGDVAAVIPDTLYLDKSVVSGNYSAPVPEPAGMMLFGSGLIGLVGFARMKRSGSR